jgi:D-alanine--poly(phosphoribitol) ligase subunit 1
MPISVRGSLPVAPRSLDDLFTESARMYPERPALDISNRSWTYSELDRESRRIEQSLETSGLVGKGCNIGLLYARSAFSYAAMIAIMRTGNVYVPLNRKAPKERLSRIIDDAGIAVLIIDANERLDTGAMTTLRQAAALRLVGSSCEHGVRFDAPLPPTEAVGGVSLVCARVPARLAYIIYTSGSTGLPKGVAVKHESVVSCMDRLQKLFATCERDRFAHFSPLSFDGSIFDVFLCWRSGAALCVPEFSETLVPFDFAVTREITVWGSVPSLANFLLKLQLLKAGSLPRIRLSFFFGEALPYELVEAWNIAAPHSRIFNLYGPTEFTICATYYECDRSGGSRHGTVPIGIALPGQQCMIVEEGRVVLEDDVPGELWLGGDQLAAGYWNNPAATRAAFVPFPPNDPQAPLWYRTGDLVSQRRSVGLTFRGRVDRQVKLRGFRIELQEIESVLRDVTGCALVAVIPLRGTAGICERIVACCDAMNCDEAIIKARCLDRLPPHMVPERIFKLDSFPLSDHGKIDYRSLADLLAPVCARPFQAQ